MVTRHCELSLINTEGGTTVRERERVVLLGGTAVGRTFARWGEAGGSEGGRVMLLGEKEVGKTVAR